MQVNEFCWSTFGRLYLRIVYVFEMIPGISELYDLRIAGLEILSDSIRAVSLSMYM